MAGLRWRLVLLVTLQGLQSINSSSQTSCSTYLTSIANNVSYNYDRRELRLPSGLVHNSSLAACIPDRKEQELVVELVSVQMTEGQVDPRPVSPCCRKPCQYTRVQSQAQIQREMLNFTTGLRIRISGFLSKDPVFFRVSDPLVLLEWVISPFFVKESFRQSHISLFSLRE